MTTTETEFTRAGARRPAPIVDGPLMQWASGLQTREKRIYAGWLVETGKLEDLDQVFERAGFNQVTIKHGSGNVVTHWAVEVADAFVIAENVQSIAEMKRTEARAGIAFGWTQNEYGRAVSVLRMRVLLRELLIEGYTDPLTVSIKSTQTGDLITALMRQYDVLEAVDAFRVLDKKPPLQPPFYACSLPLTAGPEVTRGSGGQTKEISPPVADVPTPITKEYIRNHWTKREWTALIEDGALSSLIDTSIAWSIEESKRIAAGTQQAQPQEEAL